MAAGVLTTATITLADLSRIEIKKKNPKNRPIAGPQMGARRCEG